MDRLRLPSIASMVSPAAEPLYHRSPGALSPPRGPPPALHPTGSGAAPPLDNQWTAINRPTSSSSHSASAMSPVPSAPSSSHRHHASTSTPITGSSPFPDSTLHRNHPSSPLKWEPDPAPSSRPIVSQRQDSAVSESTLSHSSTLCRDATSLTPLDPRTSSSGPRHPAPAWNSAAATRSPTPPSSSLAADATSVHSTRHDRRRASPPPFSHGPKSPATSTRQRALSDSRLSPSSQPTTSSCLSPYTSHTESSLRGVMAPPPHPAASSPPSNPLASTSTSMFPQAASSPDANLSHASVNGSNDEAHAYPRSRSLELGAAGTPRPSESNSSTQCLRCKRVWTFPPLTVDGQKFEPSKTLNDMHTSISQITNLMYAWNDEREKSFREFSREHLIQATDADVRQGRPHSTYAGTKRKPSGQIDDGTISKLRRLSCHSSPCSSQLTPPPDHSPSSSPSHHAINLDASFYDELTCMESSTHIARILRLNDSNGLVRYPTPRGSSVEQENDQSPSPVH